jgi:hypothetical protein
MKTSIVTRIIIGLCLTVSLIIPQHLFAQVNVPDIKGVKDFAINIACELTVIQGDVPSLKFTGDEDDLNAIYFKSFGDQLTIKTHKNHQHKDDVKITLVVTDLSRLSIGGAVDLFTPGILNFSNFNLEVSGVANIDMKIKSQEFKLDASGVLKGEIVGEAKEMNLDISGLVDIDASNLVSTNCEVDISGMGSAEVNVTETLDASVSGMGKIEYAGHPRVHASTSGFGRIRRL